MATVNYNLDVEGGADFVLYLNISENGVAKSLVGAVILGQIKITNTDRSSILTFSTSITNASSGQAKLSLTAEQTRKLPAQAVYDILLKDSQGKTSKVAFGSVNSNIAITEQVL